MASLLIYAFFNKSVASLDSGFPDEVLYYIFSVSCTRAKCSIDLVFCDLFALRAIGDAPFFLNPLREEELVKCANHEAARCVAPLPHILSLLSSPVVSLTSCSQIKMLLVFVIYLLSLLFMTSCD